MGFTPFNINHENFSAIMDMLNQYADPASAVLREYVSNGIDAVQGTDGASVTVILPDENSAELVIKDNGIGMSAEFMQGTLSYYANSTKKNDGGSIGEKGIGSKSAFSVSDRFTIESVHDGMKATAVNDKNAGGLQITTVKTDEGNGTTVSIPVDDENIRQSIRNKASLTLCGFDSDVLHVMNADGSDYEGMYFIDRDNMLFHVNDSLAFDLCRRNDFNIIQGGVRYAVSGDIIRSIDNRLDPFHRDSAGDRAKGVIDAIDARIGFSRYRGASLTLYVKPNTLKTNPSRESIISTPENVDAIINAIADAYDDIYAPNDGVEDARRRIDGLVRRYLENPVFADLDWNGASKLNYSVDTFMQFDYDDDGHCTYRKKPVSLGGHVFHESLTLAVPADVETAVFVREYKHSSRSSYVRKKATVKEDGSQCYPISVDSSDRMLVIVNNPDTDAECAKMIRTRRAYCEEAGLNDSDNAYIVISSDNPVEGLGFWDSKRNMFKVVEYDDYKRTMKLRAERIRKERAEARKANGGTSVAGKVTAIFGDAQKRRTVLGFSEILAMKEKQPEIMLLWANHNDFYHFADNTDEMDAIVSIFQNGTLSGGKWILVKNEGSKALMKSISENCVNHDDIDYKDNLHKLVNGMLFDMRDIDSRRAKYRMLKPYFWDDASVFGKIINSKDVRIKSPKTVELITKLDDDYTKANETHYDDDRKSRMLNTDLQGIRDMFGNECFKDALHDESGEAGIENAVLDTAGDIETFNAKYPMIMHMNKYDDRVIGDIIDYINIVDRVHELAADAVSE